MFFSLNSLLTLTFPFLFLFLSSTFSRFKVIWFSDIKFIFFSVYVRTFFIQILIYFSDREEIRLLFGRALEHVAPLGGDPDYILARYWASLEADRFRSMEEARKIWTDVMAVLGDKARFWMEQVQVKKRPNHCLRGICVPRKEGQIVIL